MSKQVYLERCEQGFNWVVLRDDGSLHVYHDPTNKDAEAEWYRQHDVNQLFNLELLPNEPLYQEIVARWRKVKEQA